MGRKRCTRGSASWCWRSSVSRSLRSCVEAAMRTSDPLRPRALKLLFAATLIGCALLPLARLGPAAATPPDSGEWPREWQARPLRPLALSVVEQRFAAQFPARIARLTDRE